VGNDAGLLFGQVFRRKHNLGFQGDFVPYMLAVKNLTYVPLLLSHMAPPNYDVIV
jgi:hypothetical protein